MNKVKINLKKTQIGGKGSVRRRILRKKKNVVFFDIGSYISYYGLFASSFTNDECIVYAIESNPLYDKITKKSKEHNQFKNFICHNFTSHNIYFIEFIRISF